MLELLAQARQQQTWFLDLVETLARTPISSVILFALVCTAVRVGIYAHAHKLHPAERKFGGARVLHWIHDLCDALVYAGILVFLLIRPFAVQTFRIPSESMVPTLKVGDLIIVNKALYRMLEPKAGDIVVFKPPAFARNEGDDPNVDYVKRLIGTPGQTIEIKDRQLYRDGVPANEPYINKESTFSNQPIDFKLVEYKGEVVPIVRDSAGKIPGRSLYDEHVSDEDLESVWDLPAAKVPPGKYLMIGDNRAGSFDGRFWGLIDRSAIVGKAWLTFWPPSRFGLSDKRP
ncbi:MAG: signal peptidase I [Fimbriimonadales bacterium]